MRRALVLGVMLISGSIVRADPPLDPRKAYVEVGVLGGAGVDFYDAVSVEGGYRPAPYELWVHADLQVGGIHHAFPSQSGSEDAITSSGHWAARVGLDRRICLEGNVWCGLGGIDVGYLRQYAISQSMPRDISGLVVVPRLGLDIGGNVRFRPGIEVAIRSSIETVAFTAAIAYAW